MVKRLTSFDQIQSPIEVAFFDLGGVVFSFHGGLEALAQAVNKPLSEVTAYWLSRDNDICRGILAPQQFYKELVSHFGVGDPDMDFLQFWTSHFDPIIATHVAMEDIQSRGVSLGILTNIYPEVFNIAISMGVIPNLDYAVIVQSSELGIVKPDLKIFSQALQTAGVLPGQAILIDDRVENTDVAEVLGWHSLRFPPVTEK